MFPAEKKTGWDFGAIEVRLMLCPLGTGASVVPALAEPPRRTGLHARTLKPAHRVH